MKCKKCGNEINENSIFCGFCGERVIINETCIDNNHLSVNVQQGELLNNQSKQDLNKKKKSLGCFGVLFKFILIILIIILLIFGVIKFIGWYKEYKFNKLVETEMLVDNFDDNFELTESELNEDWNNDGITNEQAQELGLNVVDADTDGDGLSDVDEISLYKSDPLKYSTSGDIYNDGYKVSLGYDLHKQYETRKSIITTNSDIMVEIDNAYDMGVYYKEYSGLIPDGVYLAYQPFRLFSFDGKVSLKIDDANKYDVISYNIISGKYSIIKSNIKNDCIEFNVNDDNPILIVYKKSVVNSMDVSILANINSNYDNDVSKEYYVVAVPLITKLLNHPVYVMEIDNSKVGKGTDDIFVKQINEKANGLFTIEHYYINERATKFFDFVFGDISNKIYSNVGEENKAFVDSMIVYKRISSINDLYEYLFNMFDDENEKTENLDETENVVDENFNPYDDKYSEVGCLYCGISNFDVGVNAFAFSNLVTNVSNGVCAGFSQITTSIYNNNPISKSVDGIYNLSDSAYSDIWQKRLYNYHMGEELLSYADNISDNQEKLNSKTMKNPDNEVVKALEYYWQIFNDKTRINKVGWSFNRSFYKKQTYINSGTVDSLVEKFKNNQIVSVILLNDSQHAVNAYKIVEDKNDSDILYIKAYDNNLPNDMFWGPNNTKVKYDVTITLKRIYENTLTGVKTKYVFEYNPINNKNYYYGNFESDDLDAILFIDENYKVI